MINLQFVPVSSDVKEKAKQGFTMSGEGRQRSPFRDGVVFTISDYDFRYPEKDGKIDEDAPIVPVLVTSLGDLFISRLTRIYLTKKDEQVFSKGSFTDKVNEILATNKSNGERLQAIVDTAKDHKIKVTLRNYIGEGRYGRYPFDVADFNFVP